MRHKVWITVVAAFLAGISLVLGAIQSTCKDNGKVALTFDFGPGPFTGRLLDILLEKKIHATFHVSADFFRNLTLTEYVRRAHLEGHTLGIFIPETSIWNEMEEIPETDTVFIAHVIQQIAIASNWITSITGDQPRYVRFASKRQLPTQLRRTVEQQLGLTITKPRVDIRDKGNKMDSIWNSLAKGLAQGSPQTNSFILRQRDIAPNSVASVGKIVEFLHEKGYRVVPMGQCVPPRQPK